MKLKIIIAFRIYIFASFVCGCVRGAWGGAPEPQWPTAAAAVGPGEDRGANTAAAVGPVRCAKLGQKWGRDLQEKHAKPTDCQQKQAS